MRIFPAGKYAVAPVVVTTGERWLLDYNANRISAATLGPGGDIASRHHWDLGAALAHLPAEATHVLFIQDDIPLDISSLMYIAGQMSRCEGPDLFGPSVKRSPYSPSVDRSMLSRVIRGGFLDLSCAALSIRALEKYAEMDVDPGEYGWHLSPLLGSWFREAWVDHSFSVYHAQVKAIQLCGLVDQETYQLAVGEAEKWITPRLEAKITHGYNHRIWSPKARRKVKWEALNVGLEFEFRS